MARDATAVAGWSVVIAGKTPLEKPLGSSARSFFPPETYQQIGSRHAKDAEQCLLSGAKRTWPKDGVMSACDPKRT
jgi:hypothetical protein